MARGGGSGLDVSGLIVPEDIHTAPTPGVSVRTSPDTFGAQIGRAQESLGNAIAGAGKEIGNVFLSMGREQQQAENDQKLSDLQSNLQQKFLDFQQNNQGFNATNALPAFKQSIDADIGGGQGGGGFFGLGLGLNHEYDQHAAKLRQHYLQSATAYAAKQHEVAYDASYTGYLTKTAETAVLNRTNDAAVNDSLDAISSRATEYWSQKGLDKDAVAEQAKAARGPAVQSLFNAYLSDYQYDKALNLYEANKGKVDGGSLDKMTHAMTGVQDNAILAQELNAHGPQGEHATNYGGPKPPQAPGIPAAAPQKLVSEAEDIGGVKIGQHTGNCAKGVRGFAGALFGSEYFRNPLSTTGDSNAASLSGKNDYFQKSGLYKSPLETDASRLQDQQFLDGMPVGTVISAKGGNGNGHVQIKVGPHLWASDALQGNKVLTARHADGSQPYSDFQIHYPSELAQQKINQRGYAQLSTPTMTFQPPARAAHVYGQEGGGAPGLLRHFEGFRNNAYWDKNGWRVGYGSDTITHADGSIEKVTAFTRVTQEDADRDLARRAQQYQTAIQNTIGTGAWSRLTDGQKAALTSVAYNYGHLPSGVAQAAASGGDIGQAIMGLRGDNGGINAKRRTQEAAIANGGTIPASGGNSIPQARYAYDVNGAIHSIMARDDLPIERRIGLAQKARQFGSLMQENDDEAATAIWPKVFKNEVTIDQVYGLPLQPETKKQMGEYIASHAQNAEKEERTYGNGYNDILQRMDKPESEGGITSVQQLFAAKNNGQLTTAGLDKSISYYNQLHKGEGAENRDDWQLFAQEMNRLKQDIVHEKDIPGLPHQRDPMGEKLYNQIYRNIHDQFENTLKSKDNSREASRKFLDDLDSNVMGMYRKMRNPAQELALKLAQNRGMAEAVEGEQKQITSPPLGVDKDKWDDLMRAPPMNPKNSKPWAQTDWARGVKLLLSAPDNEANKRAFNAGPFGQEYKADDLIKMLIPEQESAK